MIRSVNDCYIIEKTKFLSDSFETSFLFDQFYRTNSVQFFGFCSAKTIKVLYIF